MGFLHCCQKNPGAVVEVDTDEENECSSTCCTTKVKGDACRIPIKMAKDFRKIGVAM